MSWFHHHHHHHAKEHHIYPTLLAYANNGTALSFNNTFINNYEEIYTIVDNATVWNRVCPVGAAIDCRVLSDKDQDSLQNSIMGTSRKYLQEGEGEYLSILKDIAYGISKYVVDFPLQSVALFGYFNKIIDASSSAFESKFITVAGNIDKNTPFTALTTSIDAALLDAVNSTHAAQSYIRNAVAVYSKSIEDDLAGKMNTELAIIKTTVITDWNTELTANGYTLDTHTLEITATTD